MEKLIVNTEILVYKENELSAEDLTLVNEAKNATERSYSPYSKFRVGASVRLSNNEIISGNNQENAAYPSGLCAERTTLFYANATYPDQPVEALAIAAFTNGDFTDAPITPCGACRQVILETEKRFGNKIKIILYGKNNVYILNGIENLLPLCFDGKEIVI